MSKPTLVIINGQPGAGKTTLGRRLAADLGLPFVGKDDIKETLFGALGWEDREWSQRLGFASIELMFLHLTRLLEVGVSAVVETAFIPAYDSGRFRALQRRHDYQPIQIYCHGDTDALTRRFVARGRSNERHPGHVDSSFKPADFVTMLDSGKHGVLDIGGRLMELDMTDFDSVDYGAVSATVSAWTNLPGTVEVPGRQEDE